MVELLNSKLHRNGHKIVDENGNLKNNIQFAAKNRNYKFYPMQPELNNKELFSTNTT